MKKILSIFALTLATILATTSELKSQSNLRYDSAINSEIASDDIANLKNEINKLMIEDYTKYSSAQYIDYIDRNIDYINRSFRHLFELDEIQNLSQKLNLQITNNYNLLVEQEKLIDEQHYKQHEQQYLQQYEQYKQYEEQYLQQYEQYEEQALQAIKKEIWDSISNNLSSFIQKEIYNNRILSDTKIPETSVIVTDFVNRTASDFLSYCNDLASGEISEQMVKREFLREMQYVNQMLYEDDSDFKKNIRGSIHNYKEYYFNGETRAKSLFITSPEKVRLLEEEGCPNFYSDYYLKFRLVFRHYGKPYSKY